MKRVFLIVLTLFGLQMHANAEKHSTIHTAFIAKRNGKIVAETGNCDIQNSPCSTFKIALALMGFDSGILKDKDSPKWSFQKKYESNFQSWYTPKMGIQYGWHGDHTPETYMQNSVLWFSHQITHRLGRKKFKHYITKLNYGNKDISGTPGCNDGLLNSWLKTSLKISPREQVEFLEKLLNLSLDVSKTAQIKTMETLVKKDAHGQPMEWDGWKLYGKTGGGTGSQRWFIGWIENGGDKIVFAQYVGFVKDTPKLRANAPMAMDEAKGNILKLLQQL